MSLIAVKSLHVQRGDFDLEIPSWSVAAGEVWGVIGKNGAGKSTLLRALAGIDGISGGRIDVFGLVPHRHAESVRSRLGFMAEDMPLLNTRVAGLLDTISGYYTSWDAQYVNELLDRFELSQNARVSELSRGQGSKLRVITALAFHPQVILLDEPTAGMDVSGRRELMAVLLAAMQRPGRAMVICSHQLMDLQRMTDALLVLDGGRVRALGPTDEVVTEGRNLEQMALTWEHQC